MNLTTREREVLRLIAAGLTYAQVARALGISLHTVCTHIKNMYRKLEVHNAPAAVSRALAHGGFSENLKSATSIETFAGAYGGSDKVV